MPPIQLMEISGRDAAASLGRTIFQPSFTIPHGRTRFSFWPCLRQFGSPYVYGARVVPLTLCSILREDRSGSPSMHRKEQGRWIPGKVPTSADSDTPTARLRAAPTRTAA